uniref:Uncharacterized protein n=1 Tax=Anguilla anguilla TaxID=7936 RepID=A0A0E9VXJ4_ANGAN
MGPPLKDTYNSVLTIQNVNSRYCITISVMTSHNSN